MGLGGGEASFAYAWSLAVVESIIQTSGMGDITRLLDAIASAPNTEQASARRAARRLRGFAAASSDVFAPAGCAVGFCESRDTNLQTDLTT